MAIPTSGKIALGCVTFGREINEDTAFRILDYAVEHGITFFDTAEAYGGGASERILGRWLQSTGMRKSVQIQTKVSFHYTHAGVREALQQSLDRLQTDRVDYYLLHKLDKTVPVADCVAAMQHPAVAAVGCSNVNGHILATALQTLAAAGLPRFTMVQPPYNLLQRDLEVDLLPLCRRENIAIVPYSPLAAGFLTGKYSPDRAVIPAGTRFDLMPGHQDVYFSDRNFRILAQLQAFAARVEIPAVTLALAWAIQNPDLPAILVGARNTAHLDHALEAARFPLRPEWRAEMNSWGNP